MILQFNTIALVDRYGLLDAETLQNVTTLMVNTFPRGTVVTLEVSIISTDEPKRDVCQWESPPGKYGTHRCDTLLERDGFCPNLESHRRAEKEAAEEVAKELAGE